MGPQGDELKDNLDFLSFLMCQNLSRRRPMNFTLPYSYDERFFKAVLNLCLELSFTAG